MNKKMSIRIISLIVSFMLLVSILPAQVSAVGTTESDYTHLVFDTPIKHAQAGGALQVLTKGNVKTLCDHNGDPIQLRGMSTHGLQWYPEIINDNAFAALSNDWGANVIRLAMYVADDGYASNPDIIKKRIFDGINLAISNDMYVIVDWHVLNPGDPSAEIYSGAMDFFKDISNEYPNDSHIIYELANEPNSGNPGVTNDAEGWVAVKSYADPIIKMLRESGNKNIVIVGSPCWSQRPDLAADNPIIDSENNTMYSTHFYTGTHKVSADSTDRGNVMSNVRYALANGVAVFATEWGTSESSGDGGPYLNEANEWLEFLNANNISWCNWSLTNKNEISGAFTPYQAGKTDDTDLNPGDDKVWAPNELSVSGEYVRARIKGIPYEPIDRTLNEEPIVHADLGTAMLPSDFENSTRQGWDWYGGSGVKSALTIEQANGSKAISWEVAFPEKKPADEWASAPGIMLSEINAKRGTNQYLTFDFYIAPDKASKGILSIDLVLVPPSLGYWVQPMETFDIDLTKLNEVDKTADGLYHYKVYFDLNNIYDNKVIEADTLLRDIILAVGDIESDFAGKMYLDNIQFSKSNIPATKYSVTCKKVKGGNITANLISAPKGTKIELKVQPSKGMRLKAGTLKYTDGKKETIIKSNSFIMPAANVTVTAVFEKIQDKKANDKKPIKDKKHNKDNKGHKNSRDGHARDNNNGNHKK